MHFNLVTHKVYDYNLVLLNVAPVWELQIGLQDAHRHTLRYYTLYDYRKKKSL